jgi:hypothetical protein
VSALGSCNAEPATQSQKAGLFFTGCLHGALDECVLKVFARHGRLRVPLNSGADRRSL